MKRRPLLIAHRGDPAHAPENTLASFQSAIAKGAKAVEVDARRTRDGMWVVFHDPTLRRTTGRPGNLSDSPWEDLKRIEVASLPQVLALCRKEKAGLFLDVKISGRENELARLLKRSGFSRCMVGAATVPSLKRWRGLLPLAAVFWVTGYGRRLTQARVALGRRLGLTGFASYKRWVTPEATEHAQKAGLKVYVWTIRTPIELKKFACLGVDGIMSEVWPAPRVLR